MRPRPNPAPMEPGASTSSPNLNLESKPQPNPKPKLDDADNPAAIDADQSLDEAVPPTRASVARNRRRALANAALGLAVALGVLVAAYLVPMPSVVSIREWGEELGPFFALAFFAAYATITIAPIPRTTFTVMAGIFFGPLLGFVIAMLASMVAALLAFLLVRRLGRERVRPYLKHRTVRAVEYRLQRRGWLAVGSIRLIAAIPFSVANYLSALSSVRLLPYLIATTICMAPGTAAVVLLGDALTGESNPALLVLSACFFTVGIAGLLVDSKLPVRQPPARPTDH